MIFIRKPHRQNSKTLSKFILQNETSYILWNISIFTCKIGIDWQMLLNFAGMTVSSKGENLFGPKELESCRTIPAPEAIKQLQLWKEICGLQSWFPKIRHSQLTLILLRNAQLVSLPPRVQAFSGIWLRGNRNPRPKTSNIWKEIWKIPNHKRDTARHYR